VESGVLSRWQLHFMKGSPCRIAANLDGTWPCHVEAVPCPRIFKCTSSLQRCCRREKMPWVSNSPSITFDASLRPSLSEKERETVRKRDRERVSRNSSGSDEWCARLQTNGLIPKVRFSTHPPSAGPSPQQIVDTQSVVIGTSRGTARFEGNVPGDAFA
jgi:hypothetical protein